MAATCKHLGLGRWAYLREALPGAFALGEESPAGWLLHRGQASPPG